MKRPGRLCALACILSVNFAGMPFARADDLQKAIEAVKGVSDEALRKEFERRFSKKKSRTRTIMAVPRSANTAEAPNPVLASVGDAALVEATHATSRAIYGKDHREDLYEISAAEGIQPLVRASAALFKAVDVDAPAGGMVHLRGKPFRELRNICPTSNLKFADQPTGAFCSGTLVAPDVVLTAGHCVREVSKDPVAPEHVTSTRFVFGYSLRSANADPRSVPAGNVFSGSAVLGGESDPLRDFSRHDWALVRLDRPVPPSVAEPVTAWERAPVQQGERVFIIGFPDGMPLKYAPGAKVNNASNEAWFTADLDTFGGNSGSGVYDQASKKLIGILVQGGPDYVPDRANGCFLVNVCPHLDAANINCSGEIVSRISQVVPHFAQTSGVR